MSGEKQFKFDFGGDSNADDGQQTTFDFTGKEAALLPLMQKKLQELIGKSSGYLETLPVPVQNRVKGLKALHYQKEEIDQEFKKELAALKEKYRGKYDPIFTRRTHIISGTEEPTEEEIKVAEEREAEKKKEEEEEGEETKEETKEEAKKEEEKEAKEGESSEEKKEEDVKGIPDFWLEAMKHHDYFMDLITPKDEELLKHVTDIKCYPHGEVAESFTLEFHFSENNFIKNDVLKKTYHLVEQPGTGETLYDHVESTEIEWHAGKNLTRKTVKVQSGKGGKGRRGGRRGAGGPKTITVEKPCKSFFNFFQPDKAFDEDELDDEEMETFLEEDYELGVAIKEQLLPNAILWFTGEASAFDEGELFGDSDEEEGEEEYNSDEDPDFPPPKEGEAAQQQCAQQ